MKPKDEKKPAGLRFPKRTQPREKTEGESPLREKTDIRNDRSFLRLTGTLCLL